LGIFYIKHLKNTLKKNTIKNTMKKNIKKKHLIE